MSEFKGEDHIILKVEDLDELAHSLLIAKDNTIKDLQFEIEALTKYVLEVSTILQRNGSTEGIHDEVLDLISKSNRKQREYFAEEWDWK